MDRIHLAQDRENCCHFEHGNEPSGYFLTSWVNVSFWRRTLLHEVRRLAKRWGASNVRTGGGIKYASCNILYWNQWKGRAYERHSRFLYLSSFFLLYLWVREGIAQSV
jgi:hypothetical protein